MMYGMYVTFNGIFSSGSNLPPDYIICLTSFSLSFVPYPLSERKTEHAGRRGRHPPLPPQVPSTSSTHNIMITTAATGAGEESNGSTSSSSNSSRTLVGLSPKSVGPHATTTTTTTHHQPSSLMPLSAVGHDGDHDNLAAGNATTTSAATGATNSSAFQVPPWLTSHSYEDLGHQSDAITITTRSSTNTTNGPKKMPTSIK